MLRASVRPSVHCNLGANGQTYVCLSVCCACTRCNELIDRWSLCVRSVGLSAKWTAADAAADAAWCVVRCLLGSVCLCACLLVVGHATGWRGRGAAATNAITASLINDRRRRRRRRPTGCHHGPIYTAGQTDRQTDGRTDGSFGR